MCTRLFIVICLIVATLVIHWYNSLLSPRVTFHNKVLTVWIFCGMHLHVWGAISIVLVISYNWMLRCTSPIFLLHILSVSFESRHRHFGELNGFFFCFTLYTSRLPAKWWYSAVFFKGGQQMWDRNVIISYTKWDFFRRECQLNANAAKQLQSNWTW